VSLFSIRNTLYDRDCLIVGCGPSARYWKTVIHRCSDPVVVAIKQAYNILPKGLVDIHFFNAHNCSNYYSSCNGPNLLSVFQDDLDGPRQFNPYDLRTCVTKSRQNPWSDCLALNKRISDYSISSSGYRRPWGPGILFESVFYFLQYAGVRRICTIGFDNGYAQDYQHFYTHKSDISPPRVRSNKYDPTTINYFRHLASLGYNTGMKPMQIEGFNEPLLVQGLVSLFNQWLLQLGQELTIYTDFSGALEVSSFIKEVST